MDTVLEVRNLVKYFPVTKGIIFVKRYADVKAVDGISFSIERGETLGLVGESGCGKSTTGRCVLQLIPPTSGDVLFEGQDLCRMDPDSLTRMRRKMQLIFQDPYGSLNPRFTVAQIVGEPLLVHGVARGKELQDRVKDMLNIVGLEPDMAKRYPHMFSGGQRQRVAIARALILHPTFVVCDEPVSALDVSIQAQIINLLMELQEALKVSFLFIAHDLSVVRHISARVAVMYLGKLVEVAPYTELYKHPLHCYTRALLSAVPIPDPLVEAGRQRILLSGEVPSSLNIPSGCCFHPRCWQAKSDCADVEPPLVQVGSGHWVACHCA